MLDLRKQLVEVQSQYLHAQAALEEAERQNQALNEALDAQDQQRAFSEDLAEKDEKP